MMNIGIQFKYTLCKEVKGNERKKNIGNGGSLNEEGSMK